MPSRKIQTIIIAALIAFPAVTSAFAQTPRRAAPSKPASSAEVINLAREADKTAARGDWEGAIIAYEKLIKLAPGVAESHSNLGTSYYSAGRPGDAIAPLRQALKLKPALTQARYFLGAALAESGQCQEALPHLKRDAPNIPDKELKRVVQLAGVRCGMKLNRPEAAIEFLQLLNRDFPRDPEASYLAVHIYSDLSVRASQELLYYAPSSHQVRLLNAEALEAQGRWEEAASEYRQVLAMNPRQPGIHYRLGRLLLSAPEPSPTALGEAKKEFNEELKVDPNNAGAEYVLGELARRDREWPEAIEHFIRAAKLDPSFADAHIGLGRSLLSARRFPDAVAPLESAVKLQPDNPAAHYHLAVAYSRTGRKEEAERESVVFRQTSEKARQMKQDVQMGILGPQKAEP